MSGTLLPTLVVFLRRVTVITSSLTFRWFLSSIAASLAFRKGNVPVGLAVGVSQEDCALFAGKASKQHGRECLYKRRGGAGGGLKRSC